MEESDREDESYDEKNRQDILIISARYHQPNKAHQQDYEFSCDHVGQDRAYKEAVFAFKKRAAVWTVMPNVKRLSDD